MNIRQRALKPAGDHGQSAAALAANAQRRQQLAAAVTRLQEIDDGRGQMTPAQVRTAVADMARVVLALVNKVS